MFDIRREFEDAKYVSALPSIHSEENVWGSSGVVHKGQMGSAVRGKGKGRGEGLGTPSIHPLSSRMIQTDRITSLQCFWIE